MNPSDNECLREQVGAAAKHALAATSHILNHTVNPRHISSKGTSKSCMSSQPTSPEMVRWLLTAETSAPNQFPPLPVITLKDMKSTARVQIKDWYNRRDWEKCQHLKCTRTGTDYKLMKCAGCGTIPGLQTLYCSKKCQYADRARHQQICGEIAHKWGGASAIEASISGIEESVWRNCHLRKTKRAEGLVLISIWAFDQLARIHPGINRRKMCFCIHFRSSKSGKGNIVPVAFQLESMADSLHGSPAPQNFERNPGGRIGAIQVIVDGVRHLREFRDLNVHSATGCYLQQWPWIYATIASMGNYNMHLANSRLQHLYPVVNIMERRGVAQVLEFKAPNNLDKGEKWILPDFAKWQGIFGDIVGF